MRVFVLCTGRCGSTTFGAAVSHCTNYSSGQESQNHLIGPARYAFPDQHIEIDNRLSWTLGKLDQAYGDDPFYVHLLRDPEVVAQSFVSRKGYGIMKAWREGILAKHFNRSPHAPVRDVALEMIDTITTNIQTFLKTKPRAMTMRVESMADDFPAFWHAIGAQGDLNAAMAEWSIRHNATKAGATNS